MVKIPIEGMLSTVSSQESEKSPFSGSIEDGSLGNHELKLGILMHKKDSSVTIEIEDNAPGIPGGIKDKILQPFFTIKKGTAGTGAGLSIIHDIKRSRGKYILFIHNSVNLRSLSNLI